MSVRQKQAKSSDIDFLGSIRSIGEKYRPVRVPSFAEYAQAVTPYELHEWQLEELCPLVQRLIDEPGTKIVFHAPPGVGKSTCAIQRGIAYFIGRRPEIRVYPATYAVHKTKDHTGVARDLLASEYHREIFTDPQGWVERTASEERFTTAARAACMDGQPSVAALGVKTGVIGRHPDIFLLDDLYATFEDARSEAINSRTCRFVENQVMGRVLEETSVGYFQHRMGPDDAARVLIEDHGFEYYRAPAVMDRKQFQVPASWPEGKALSPRRTKEWCEKFQSKPENGPVWRAMYQADFEADSGKYIDASRFEFVEKLPEACFVFARGWDLAWTEEGDPSVGFLLAIGTVTGTMYGIDYYEGRHLAPEIAAKIRSCAELDPGHTIVAVERAGGSIPIIQYMAQDPFFEHPRAIQEVKVGGYDKYTRATGWIDRAQCGRIKFVGDPNEPRWRAFTTECNKFRNLPTDRDDKIDALTVAFEALKEYRDTSHLRETERIIPGTEAYYNALMDGQS